MSGYYAGYKLINFRSIAGKVLLSLGLGFCALAPIAKAETVSVNLFELQRALDDASVNGDAVTQALLGKVSEAINNSDIGFSEGELLFQDSATDVTVEGGCNRTVILRINTDITIEANTALSLTLDSLYDPIVLSLDVHARVNSYGEARQIVGIRLGKCRNLARDSFKFDISGPAKFSLAATLHLNPEWTAESTLSLYPELSLTGELAEFSANVNVDDTVLAKLLENFIEDRIEDTFTSSRLSSELQSFEQSTNQKIDESLNNGRIDIELPEANDEQVLALYQLLQPDARFPITLELIRQHRQQLLASILFGEPTSTDTILADALLCESASAFLSSENLAPVYAGSAEQCTAIDPMATAGQTTWSDALCTEPLDYRPTTINQYCDVALDPTRLGNAASNPAELGQWTHSPGSRFDIGALSVAGLMQPFMQRFAYKRVQTNRGLCELEMRVYSNTATPVERPRRAMMAFHGGSWQYRASGFIGIESTATHFTDQGFVVFAPFYRLIGETDGNVECNNASLDDILADVNDAVDWVQMRFAQFGLHDKISLFGQSAGGHLALSLAANRAEEIRRAVLFYTPSDFSDFAAQVKNVEYTNPSGLKILEAVTGSSIESLDVESDIVQNNSFPAIIARSPDAYPPMFIMHGEMDSLLSARQSVRLCNALNGSQDPNIGPASLIPDLNELSSVTRCDARGSQLHLIAEGEHALDLCLAPGLCLSGSEESAERVAQSIQTMLAWTSAENVAISDRRGDKASVGFVHWPSVLVMFFMLGVRLRRSRSATSQT